MSSSTQETHLPRQIDPRKFAQQGISVAGTVALAQLPRLESFLADKSGDVTVELQFYVDEQRARVIDGRLSADVQVTCQRCLEPMMQTVEANVHLAIVWDDEQAKQVDSTRDAWIVAEGQTDIYTVIEEELLLSIPHVNYHDSQCIPAEHYESGDAVELDTQPKKENPFQALAAMKATMSNDKPDN